MNELMQKCQGKWQDLLMICAGLDRRFLNGRHGPCPLCGGKDRFRFDNKENRGTYICNQCGAGDGAALLMRLKGWDFGTLVSELEEHVGRANEQIATAKTASDSQLQSMQRIWDLATPIVRGDPVDLHLKRRGLDLPRWPDSLRYAEDLRHSQEGRRLPAMVARVDAPDGSLAQIHQTFLTLDGEKAEVEKVRMLHWGPFADGAAVRFGPPGLSVKASDDSGSAKVIGIAEGIETALSCAVMHRFPVWAALNAQMLLKWNPPTAIDELYIFGDNDANYTGQARAYSLANRLAILNKNLWIVPSIPDPVGQDWNDHFVAKGA